MDEVKGFAVSWFFAPYLGSADLDFFKRIKNCSFSFDVVQAARSEKDERILRHATTDINRFEITTDHKNPRTARSRREFKNDSIAIFNEKKSEYSFIISHSNEMVSHDVAAQIKKENRNIPWIAYFGDLFAKNPYVKYIPNYPLVDEDIRIEHQTIIDADLIILNNEYQKNLMFVDDLKVFEEKCVIIPHCFDPKMYPPVTNAYQNDRYVFGHLGTLYHAKRMAEPLLRAVDRLIEIYPKYKDKFEIVFYGGQPSSHDISVHAFMKNRNTVRFEDQISYIDSLRIMQEVDCLVIIDGIFNEKEDDLAVNPFLPGKLMDYMGANKPIMAITMDAGPTSDILKSTGNLRADEKIDRIAYVLKRYIDGKVMPKHKEYLSYTVETIARKMDEAIYSVLRDVA